MVIKNSLSILMSEFRVVFKVLFYFAVVALVCAAVFVGLAGPALRPLQTVLNDANVISDIKGAVQGLTDGHGSDGAMDTIVGALVRAKNAVQSNTGSLVAPICLLLAATFVCKFLFMLANLPTGEVIRQSMSTSAHTRLLTTYVEYLRKSLLFSLLYTLMAIPLNAVIVIIALLIAKLSSVFGFFAWMFAAAFALVGFSVRLSMFAMWVPSIVAEKNGVIDGLKNNFKELKSAFVPALSCNFFIIVLTYCFSVAFAVFTFGILPLILFPTAACLMLTSQLVIYYNVHKQKYYIDPVTIVDAANDLRD